MGQRLKGLKRRGERVWIAFIWIRTCGGLL
jgi:hypothetical protein